MSMTIYPAYLYKENATIKDVAKLVKELADIISCCVIIAGKEGFDLEQALNDCYERNKLRSENKGDKK